MIRMSKRGLHIALAALTGFLVLAAADKLPQSAGDLMATADARIGRPLTPMSYAGAARRTARRGAYVAGAAAAAGAAAYGSSCYQTVDAYGRVHTQCP
jgi:hypothetical protein